MATGTWGTGAVSLRWIDADSGEDSPFEPEASFGSFSQAGYGFDVSRDLRWLAYSHGEITGDVWMLEDRRAAP